MKGTKGSYKEKGFTMDEKMDEVVESKVEIIDDTEKEMDEAFYMNPTLVVLGFAGAAVGGFVLARKHIANAIDGVQKKIVDNWCAKHGKTYVDIALTDKEN